MLASVDWAFAQEKLVVALPLQGGHGRRRPRSGSSEAGGGGEDRRGTAGSRKPRAEQRAASALVTAAAALAGVLARSVVRSPATPVSVAVLTLLVALTGCLTYAVLLRDRRRQVLGLGAAIALVLASSVGYSWLSDIAGPGALTSHASAAHGSTAHGSAALASGPLASCADTSAPASTTSTLPTKRPAPSCTST